MSRMRMREGGGDRVEMRGSTREEMPKSVSIYIMGT